MPAGWVSAGAAVLGAGASIYGASQSGKGGSSPGKGGPVVSYGGSIPNQDAAWTNEAGLLGQDATQTFDTATALNQQSLSQGQAIDYNPYQQASNLAGQQTGQLANQYQGYQGQMEGQAANAIGQQGALQAAGNQVYQTALDPQSALYNSTAQKVQDQAAATNSMYGLGQSGAGAGIQNEAMQNFNMDWQNQQLARQAQGVSSLSQANNTALNYGNQAGQDLTAAGAYGAAVPGLTQQAAQIPLGAQQQIAANPGQLANQYVTGQNNAASPVNAQMANQLQYMTGGSGSQQGAAGAGLAQNQFNAQQQQGAVAGLTTGLNQLAGLWKQPSSPTGYTDQGLNTGGSGASWTYDDSSLGSNAYAF